LLGKRPYSPVCHKKAAVIYLVVEEEMAKRLSAVDAA
jgi:hypothetical protein